MNRVSRLVLRSAVLASLGGSVALGAEAAQTAAPSDNDALRTELERLRREVAELKQAQQDLSRQQLETLSARDVDATVEKVLRDADRRSQFLQLQGFTAGYDKGRFGLQSADGKFSLKPSLQFQFRHTLSWQDDGKEQSVGGSDNDNIQSGFEVRRMKLQIDGNAFSKDLQYYFLWANASNGGGLNLEQAWVKWDFADDWGVRAGQFLSPVFHEQTVGSRRLLANDRSLANLLITRTNGEALQQGVSLVYESDPLIAEFGVTDGFRSANTDFRDAGENWGAFARVNWFLSGKLDGYSDFTARGNKDDLLVLGGGVDVTQNGDDTEYLHTADVQWENTGGLNAYAAYYGSYIDGDEDEAYNWGALVQAGYLFMPDWEVFARYDITVFDDEVALVGDTEDTFHEITAGVNWFIQGHAAKVTFDISYLPSGAPSDQGGLGVLANDDAEFILRTQFQLLL